MIDFEPEAIQVAVTFFCVTLWTGRGTFWGLVHTPSLSIVDRGWTW